MITHCAQIRETHISWALSHLSEGVFDAFHEYDTNNDTIVKLNKLLLR